MLVDENAATPCFFKGKKSKEGREEPQSKESTSWRSHTYAENFPIRSRDMPSLRLIFFLFRWFGRSVDLMCWAESTDWLIHTIQSSGSEVQGNEGPAIWIFPSRSGRASVFLSPRCIRAAGRGGGCFSSDALGGVVTPKWSPRKPAVERSTNDPADSVVAARAFPEKAPKREEGEKAKAQQDGYDRINSLEQFRPGGRRRQRRRRKRGWW